ncbi:MAG: pyridoxal-dependent decarboxylase, exosortase A system-associated, partial [Sphingomicrobium sp.]
MKPTGPMPPQFGASDDGQLLIGGRRADELVEEAGGTPLFVYDNNIIGGQIARFQAAMTAGISLYYTVAANPYEPLLNFIGRYVDGFRVVSQGELERLKRAELAGIPMTFAGPGKTDAEIDAALRAGATLSIESEGEAERAIRAGERLGIQPRLGVRITPTLEMDHVGRKATDVPSPFGVDANRAPALIAGLIEAGVDWRGLHM